MLTVRQAATFRRLSVGDPETLRGYLGAVDAGAAAIEPRYLPLVRLAALVMADPPEPAYQHEVRRALDAGASVEIGVLAAVAPIAGSARMVSAAPKLATALGYDVEAGLADPGEPASGTV